MPAKDKAAEPTLNVNSLRDQAKRVLRGWIVAGELVPGELYTIRGVSDRLGVSATPVREALLDLANQGIVEVSRNRGFQIRPVDEKMLDELMYIRMLLEVGSIEHVAGKLSTDRAAHYEQLVDRMDELAKVRSEKNVAEYLDISRDFHLGLIGELGMPRLTELIAQMRDQARLYALGRDDNLVAANQEHRELLEAIVRDDGATVREVATKHLLNTRSVWADDSTTSDLVGEAADARRAARDGQPRANPAES